MMFKKYLIFNQNKFTIKLNYVMYYKLQLYVSLFLFSITLGFVNNTVEDSGSFYIL